MVVSLYLLFEVLSTVFCLHYLYGEKVKCDIVTLSFIGAELVWMHLIYLLKWNYSWSLLIFPVIAIYCGMRFGFEFRKILINNILCSIIISILQATIMLVLFLCLNINSINEMQTAIINGFIFIIIALGLRNVKINQLSKILHSNEKIIVVSLAIVIINVCFFLISYRYDKGLNVAYYVVLATSIVIIIIGVIDIGKHKMKAKEMETELRLHKLYEKSFQNLIDDIRARQHEFDNHINTIYSQHYLYHTYDELVEVQKKYCQNIVQANSYNKLLSKGNSIVLGFLYSKFSEAEKSGIDVEYKVKIGDMDSNVPIYKVIELIGNLINNAIEALEGQEDLNKLKVVMIEQPYEIAIDISNECRDIDYEKVQKFFKKGYSEKGENRGYGLYNIKKICEEYDIALVTVIKTYEHADRLHFMLIINKPL